MLSTTASTSHPPGVGVSATCDHFMLMHVEQLARTSTTLSNAVQGLETRQAGLSERLSEVCGCVQGLQEEHLVLASRQDMVAELVQHKSQEKEFLQLMDQTCSPSRASNARIQRIDDLPALEARLDDQERRLTKLGVDVHLLANRVSVTRPMDPFRKDSSLQEETSSLADRLVELEKGQKKVLLAAQKSLKLASGLQQQYRQQLQRQDSIESNIADSALSLNLVAQHSVKPQPGVLSDSDGSISDALISMMRSMQERVDRSLQDISSRLDSIQDVGDQRCHSACLQVCRKVPDIDQRIDDLWAQCKACTSKVQAHDVQIRLLATHLEEQKLLSLEINDANLQVDESITQQATYAIDSRSSLTTQRGADSVARRQPPSASNNRPHFRSKAGVVDIGTAPILQPSELQSIPTLLDSEVDGASQEPPSPTVSLSYSVSSTGAFSATSGRTMDTTMDTARGTSAQKAPQCSKEEMTRRLELFGGSSVFNRYPPSHKA